MKFTLAEYFGPCTVVAPFTGAWIEIAASAVLAFLLLMSHPSRVRGLKSNSYEQTIIVDTVAPFTGAWIEIDPTEE